MWLKSKGRESVKLVEETSIIVGLLAMCWLLNLKSLKNDMRLWNKETCGDMAKWKNDLLKEKRILGSRKADGNLKCLEGTRMLEALWGQEFSGWKLMRLFLQSLDD